MSENQDTNTIAIKEVIDFAENLRTLAQTNLMPAAEKLRNDLRPVLENIKTEIQETMRIWWENEKNQKALLKTLIFLDFIANFKQDAINNYGSFEDYEKYAKEQLFNSQYAPVINILPQGEMWNLMISISQNNDFDIDEAFSEIAKELEIAKKTEELLQIQDLFDEELRKAGQEGIYCYNSKKYFASASTLIGVAEGMATSMLIEGGRAKKQDNKLIKLLPDGQEDIGKKNKPKIYKGMQDKSKVLKEMYSDTYFEVFDAFEKVFSEHNSWRHGNVDAKAEARSNKAMFQVYALIYFKNHLIESSSSYEEE